jgi:hypothetical protein
LFWEKSTAGCFVVREKYCWLVADKPSQQGERLLTNLRMSSLSIVLCSSCFHLVTSTTTGQGSSLLLN